MNNQSNDRFADPGDTIYNLMSGIILVECPRCAACASHQPVDSDLDNRDWFAPRRMICASCGLVRQWAKKEIRRCWRENPARDDYFNEVLWIRGSFGPNEIWAYNWRHLDIIEKYVSANHRLNVHDPQNGWANRSFLNRLPTWITSAKNRNDILNTIKRIRSNRGNTNA